MNTLFLHPTDTLFFRDGRPMSGSLSGHGAAWPLPTVVNAALHAALHRADLEKLLGDSVHGHDQIRLSGGRRERTAEDSRKFGSLVSAGPFPVDPEGLWFFPRPADALRPHNTRASFLPSQIPGSSSLPPPLLYPVASLQPPTKEKAAPWWSSAAWAGYLRGEALNGAEHYRSDSDFLDTEHAIGIGVSPESGTQDGERFYSAHSLRLCPGWSLGLLAESMDKVNGDPAHKRDLVAELFPNSGSRTPVIVGGQQRVCSVERRSGGTLDLPAGLRSGFTDPQGKHLLKWVLLTPAIFPSIGGHPGGWLPCWVCHTSGRVMLKAEDTNRGGEEGRAAWRRRVAGMPPIKARLTAAITGKPLTVTGYAHPLEADADRLNGGAKPAHFAVPAGSVYYFECDSQEDAEKLAATLNWHGAGDPTAIRCRRSTLMGEKGFGLGVCAGWRFHDRNVHA